MDFDELFGYGHNKFICCGQFMDFFLGRGRPVWWYITGSDFFGQATQEVRIGLDCSDVESFAPEEGSLGLVWGTPGLARCEALGFGICVLEDNLGADTY